MIIGVIKERADGECRVALTPATVKKLLTKGLRIFIEHGAGERAGFLDSSYVAVGAEIVETEKLSEADIFLKIMPPTGEEIGWMCAGKTFVSLLNPRGGGRVIIDQLVKANINTFALEMIPRISRAQSMDVLSSQANIAGYKAVLVAAGNYPGFIPMMMTSAGSVPPAKLLVLGVGVAGLQAIATARRLGAKVEAFDVRPEVKEQVESLGAKFMELDLGESGAGEGGYAKELSEEAKKKQLEMLNERIGGMDIVVTTALIPGRPAPRLISEEGVRKMRTGSVIVDMATENGGNCEVAEKGKVVVKHGVTIVGYPNLPSMVANHASQFFSNNLFHFLSLMLKNEGANTVELVFDFEDEIIDKSMVAYEGVLRNLS